MTAPSVGVSRSDDDKSASAKTRRKYKFRDYLSRKALLMLALGFSSGLPFLLVGNTFSYWLADEHVALAAIGFLSWVNIAYSFQFIWAPLLDRVPTLKFLGQRRGWLLLSQLSVGAGLCAMAFFGLRFGLAPLVAAGIFVTFAAATQDIALAAWRIEIATDADELGLLTSANTFGFRIALLITDSIILSVAQHLSWPFAYTTCGIGMGVGVIATLLAPEPIRGDAVARRNEAEKPLWTPRGLFDAIIGPFIVFFRTHGTTIAILMLLGISLYRLPDFLRGPLIGAFYGKVGIAKDTVAAVRATVGLLSTFAGIAAGGALCLRIGYMRALLVGGVCQGLGIAAFALLTIAGPNTALFTAIMCFDDFALGMAGVTLVAYMSSLTSLGYTATQYALLSSTYAWAGKLLKGFSGLAVTGMAQHVGLMNAYAVFFISCGAIAIPSLILFWLLDRNTRKAAVNRA
jgi:PAT family beta-lactamase induction signal transducer AmpG